MAAKQLGFEELNALSEFLEAHQSPYVLSEIQGLCLGIICTGRQKEMRYWQAQLEKTILGDELSHLPEVCTQQLEKLLKIGFQELTHPLCQLNLLLPEDDDPIEIRLQSVADWCKGFIYGLGLGSPEPAIWSQPNVKEALEDIAQIQKLDPYAEESNESEKDYLELVEYLKIATILIFEECSETLILQGQSNHGLH